MRWHKVQFACREKLCGRKAFTEQIGELPAGARVTGRLRRHVAKTVGDGAAVSVACAGLMSWPIAHAAWVQHGGVQVRHSRPGREPIRDRVSGRGAAVSQEIVTSGWPTAPLPLSWAALVAMLQHSSNLLKRSQARSMPQDGKLLLYMPARACGLFELEGEASLSRR